MEASLIGLVGGGRLGQTFARQTTNPMRRDAPVAYDVSAIDDSEMDLQAATLLACQEDRMKARGFVEDSGMVICGGLPSAETPQLTAAVRFSQAEQDLLIGRQDPPRVGPDDRPRSRAPGRGKFVVKVGGRPGIPVDVQLTATELSINDTNKLWHHQSRVGRRATPAPTAVDA